MTITKMIHFLKKIASINISLWTVAATLVTLTLSAHTDARAGEIRALDPQIQIRKVSAHRYSIEFCEGGSCSPINRREGHSITAFRDMSLLCQNLNSNQVATDLLKAMVLFGASYFSGGTALTIGLGGITAIDLATRNASNTSEAAEKIIPLLRSKQTSYLRLEEFNQLYNGLETCIKSFETTPAMWLPTCDASVKCKSQLAKDLYLSEKQIAERSSFDLFFIRFEVLRSDNPFGMIGYNQMPIY